MSSFIIQDETINKLVNFFVTCAYSKEEYKPYITREINKFGYNLEYDENDKNPDANNLGQRMKVLNKKAYNNAYKIKGDFGLFRWNENLNEYNIYQILKSLQCFIYQCSEGEIFKDKLYITLSNIEKILINHIVMNLKDFKEAKWE